MSILDEYVRVSDRRRCPRCGSPDWCLIHESGRKCVCARDESGKPMGDAGWLHYLPEGKVKPVVARVKRKREYLSPSKVREHYEGLRARADIIRQQASLLGLSYKSLLAIHTRYDGDAAVLAFPMYDAQHQITGLRYRRADGRKWALKGGREGVFLPRGFNRYEPVFVTEGPTDAAAAWDAGLRNVMGRPSCTGASAIIQAMFAHLPVTPLIFLADPDGPGLDGARRLAGLMRNPCVVLSGPDDVRDFVSQFNLKSKAGRVIMKGIDGDAHTTWRPVFHNTSGMLCNFVKQIRKA